MYVCMYVGVLKQQCVSYDYRGLEFDSARRVPVGSAGQSEEHFYQTQSSSLDTCDRKVEYILPTYIYISVYVCMYVCMYVAL